VKRTPQEFVVTDELNDAALRVVDNGETLELAFVNWTAGPASVQVTLPRSWAALDALQEAMDLAYENRDVYLALLREHLKAARIPKQKRTSRMRI
jgi:hypothetical protein